MPMFFFISGYIAYKHFSFWSFDNYKKRLGTKLKVQLIPTIIFWSIFAYIIGHRIAFPGGFWFTEVLFEMFLIYFTVALFAKRLQKHYEEILLISIALIMYGIKNSYAFTAIPLLALSNLGSYFIFFVLGLMCKKYNPLFLCITENTLALTFCIIFPTVSLLALYGTSHLVSVIDPHVTMIINLINGFCLITVIFTMFRRSENYWNKKGIIQNAMGYIGRRTLDIYMLHYFFLPVLPSLAIYFHQNTSVDIIELLVVGGITLMITGVVLLVSAFLRTSPFLANLLFGAKPKKA